MRGDLNIKKEEKQKRQKLGKKSIIKSMVLN